MKDNLQADDPQELKKAFRGMGASKPSMFMYDCFRNAAAEVADEYGTSASTLITYLCMVNTAKARQARAKLRTKARTNYRAELEARNGTN